MIETCPHPRPEARDVQSLEGLLYFVWEREAIRMARENEHPAPWTADPVLARYKFTNIHRRDDRVSKWIIDRVINPNAEDPHLWFTLLIVRLVNWPPTLQRLIDAGVIPCTPATFNAEAFERVLEARKAEGAKVYSGAYMVYPTKMEPGGNKSRAVAKYIIGDVINYDSDITATLVNPRIEVFVNALSLAFGVSTFMAGQVAADLTYTPAQLGGAMDLYAYAPIGPGSSKGLNYLLKRAPFAGWTSEAFNAQLRTIIAEIRTQLDITDLTLHDVQNVMCEYSKYCRAVLGEGKPKSLYNAELEF